MPEGYLLMSAKERERSHLVRRTIEKALSQREAAERLGIGQRQFKRLVRAWKLRGDAGLINRQRGRAAHNQLAEAARVRIERLLRETYPDFGPDSGSGETGGTGWDRGFAGDGAAHSDPSEIAPAEEAAGEACLSAQGAPPTVWRVGPDRRQSTRLVRRPRATLHIDRAILYLTAPEIAGRFWS